ncbi:SRR1-like protein [Pelodytes ibericus]
MEMTDWQVVKKKKAAKKTVGSKKLPIPKVPTCPESSLCDPIYEQNNVTQGIYTTVENLRQTEFWDSCKSEYKHNLFLLECLRVGHQIPVEDSEGCDVCRCLLEGTQLETIHTDGIFCTVHNLDCVCYGLGSFSSCVLSRNQLAFLLLILDHFKIPRKRCYVFDPVFTPVEISVLQELGFTVILENEEGKRSVCKPTLFYMPHCGKALYNNLLYSNWSQHALSNMIIIGNSFKSIEERLLSRILQRHYAYIYQSLQVVKEAAFPENHHYNDVFNDTSIHYFPIQNLRTLPIEIWQLQEEPQYQECEDLEIIRNQER